MAITVEQTTQLIQLILNSALMMAISLAWWGVVWLRHSAISTQLQAHQRRMAHLRGAEGHSLDQIAHQRQLRLQIQARYRLTRHSALVMHVVLLALVSSVFSLALRTLMGGNWLIPLALVLFVLGIGGLLLSVGLALLEFYQMGLLEEAAPTRTRSRRSPMLALPEANRAQTQRPSTALLERVGM
ncbi:hypothetical protein [Pseudanabaena sp. FACHB-2040]|uniref:hypothetical protein n=1 Tax=Pseudanabaena sp. FACHB-2040 TaxID=2692859 RepID=UPI001684CA5A|nr:hypothetical protein [Pseudanabaena sp. FACHB-2040]MBD2259799.1 hypothetical protein [Pseudanabaena sp. FACHB-2040]